MLILSSSLLNQSELLTLIKGTRGENLPCPAKLGIKVLINHKHEVDKGSDVAGSADAVRSTSVVPTSNPVLDVDFTKVLTQIRALRQELLKDLLLKQLDFKLNGNILRAMTLAQ